jgi:phosphinothricin acetyltransferase
MTAPALRPAVEADIPGLLAIWNPVIRDTAITFTDAEHSPVSLARLLAERRAAGHAFLVAEAAGEILGFATFGQFRAGRGYRRSFEHTIHLAPQARGRGLGRALMAVLEGEARAAGGHVLLAGVSAENPAGIAFHAAIGYHEVARLGEVGFKFGRFIDLVLMEKRL